LTQRKEIITALNINYKHPAPRGLGQKRRKKRKHKSHNSQAGAPWRHCRRGAIVAPFEVWRLKEVGKRSRPEDWKEPIEVSTQPSPQTNHDNTSPSQSGPTRGMLSTFHDTCSVTCSLECWSSEVV